MFPFSPRYFQVNRKWSNNSKRLYRRSRTRWGRSRPEWRSSKPPSTAWWTNEQEVKAHRVYQAGRLWYRDSLGVAVSTVRVFEVKATPSTWTKLSMVGLTVGVASRNNLRDERRERFTSSSILTDEEKTCIHSERHALNLSGLFDWFIWIKYKNKKVTPWDIDFSGILRSALHSFSFVSSVCCVAWAIWLRNWSPMWRKVRNFFF